MVAKYLSERRPEDDPLTRQRVNEWRTSGIPWRWRHELAAWAVERGITIPKNFLA